MTKSDDLDGVPAGRPAGRASELVENESLVWWIVLHFKIALLLRWEEGDGPIPEVLQYRANPWRSRSKPLNLRRVPKISLISKSPNGGRIRY